MNIHLLEWGLFTFMIGLILSLPLGAVYYLSTPGSKTIFSNPRKLKAAHLDFFSQSFAIGLVYLLEFATQIVLPTYVIIPLIFGSICNPLIFLLEATPLPRIVGFSHFYKLLKAISPLSLYFAWFMIAFEFLPDSMNVLLSIFGGGTIMTVGYILMNNSKMNAKKQERL